MECQTLTCSDCQREITPAEWREHLPRSDGFIVTGYRVEWRCGCKRQRGVFLWWLAKRE